MPWVVSVNDTCASTHRIITAKTEAECISRVMAMLALGVQTEYKTLKDLNAGLPRHIELRWTPPPITPTATTHEVVYEVPEAADDESEDDL